MLLQPEFQETGWGGPGMMEPSFPSTPPSPLPEPARSPFLPAEPRPAPAKPKPKKKRKAAKPKAKKKKAPKKKAKRAKRPKGKKKKGGKKRRRR